MTAQILSSMTQLTHALQAEAEACLGDCYLVTVDFENVRPGAEGLAEVAVNRLKVSARTCFLQATLTQNGEIVFKGRAIFKANSASQPG